MIVFKSTAVWLLFLSLAATNSAFLSLPRPGRPALYPQRSASLLPVAATPVSPPVPAANSTSGDSSNNENGKDTLFQGFKDLREANIALDNLADKCSNIMKEPVITRADECQSQWEAMKGSSLEPDTVSFNTVLKAWSKCCHALADYKKHADTTPHVTTTTTMNEEHPLVYTAKDAAERATLLLLSQEQDFENGIIDESARPDTVSYNEAIGAWAKSGLQEAPQNAERLLKRMMDHEYIEPNGISYNAVVDAWAYSGKPDAVQKVKQIWQKMEQLYSEDERIKPTIRTVNSIIQAHTKQVQDCIDNRDVEGARKLAREADEFLDFMRERYEQTKDQDHMPDVMTYTSVMDAYGRCGRYHSTLRAKAILENLKELYKTTENPKLKPNFRTYTCLIGAWSKTRSPDSPAEAEKLLQEMLDSNDPDMVPNTRTFTSVIYAWGRSNYADKSQRVLKVLKRMKDLYKEGNIEAKPSLIAYNAALDACARCQGELEQQTEALKIAFAILKAIQIDPNLEANVVTYSTLLRACSFLLPAGEERNKIGTAVFEKAKKAGMVDFRVLLQLKKVVDGAVLQVLLEGVPQDSRGTFDFNNVPPGWNRNVR